jgi:alkanesulfonate monooxygenase SsuD/methylene tetrahydromethanopterin reductase-like flavin-dependent oxidoreductase (luciferase family)
MAAAPFVPGSISIRLAAHGELPAVDLVDEFCGQAALACGAGFDGVMISEHHGATEEGYLPNPLQMASFVLAATPTGWAAPCPLLLSLRPTALVAEEAAWLQARFPGRVGIGVGAGASRATDHAIMGRDVGAAGSTFKQELPRLVGMLRGEDLGDLAGDAALDRARRHPVPVMSMAMSGEAARRAARVGAGMLVAHPEVARLADLCGTYERAGGTLSKTVLCAVWIGTIDQKAVRAQQRYLARYGLPPGQAPYSTIVDTDPVAVAERLVMLLGDTNADALDLRPHLPGVPAGEVREQILLLASEVLPRVRGAMLGGHGPQARGVERRRSSG